MKAFTLGIIILLGSISIACGAGRKEIVFRPVTLRVLDAETKQPLEGISVKVVNITFSPKRKMYQGLVIEQIDIEKHILYSYKTDYNGFVEIPRCNYWLSTNNFLHSQYILINIDAIDVSDRKKGKIFDAVGLYSKEGELFYRPKSIFKAALISSYPYPLDPERYFQLEDTKSYYSEVFNGHELPSLTEQELKVEPSSFFCEHEEFDIYLERFIGM